MTSRKSKMAVGKRAHSHKYARHTTRRRRADACAIESFPWTRVRSDIQRHLSSRPLPSSLSIFSLHLPPIGLLLLSRFKHRGLMRANVCGDYRKSERVIFMQLPAELHQRLPTRVHRTCHWKNSWKFSDCFQLNPLHLLINVRSSSNTSRFTSLLR